MQFRMLGSVGGDGEEAASLVPESLDYEFTTYRCGRVRRANPTRFGLARPNYFCARSPCTVFFSMSARYAKVSIGVTCHFIMLDAGSALMSAVTSSFDLASITKAPVKVPAAMPPARTLLSFPRLSRDGMRTLSSLLDRLLAARRSPGLGRHKLDEIEHAHGRRVAHSVPLRTAFAIMPIEEAMRPLRL